MRCSTSREYLSLLMDDMLDEAKRLAVAEHLVDCEDCRRHQWVLGRARQALRSQMQEPSENFDWNVQLGIQKALRERAVVETAPNVGWSFWRPALMSATAVAAVVIVAGTMMLGQLGGAIEGPAGGSVEQPAATTTTVASQVRTPSSTASSPDLSGAVRSQPLSIDTTGEGFGIRTVADQTLSGNPHYEAQLPPFADRPANAVHPTALRMRSGRVYVQYGNETVRTLPVGLNYRLHAAKLRSADATDTAVVSAPKQRR